MTAYFCFCRFNVGRKEIKRGVVVAEGAMDALQLHVDACRKAIKGNNSNLAGEPEVTGLYCEECEKHRVYPTDMSSPIWNASIEIERKKKNGDVG